MLCKIYEQRRTHYWHDQIKNTVVKYFARINAVVHLQTLGLLIGAGVNLSESLDIVVSIIDNRILADTLNEARDKIIKQANCPIFKTDQSISPIAIYMISTGEESGQLDVMLTTVANNYEEELEKSQTSWLSVSAQSWRFSWLSLSALLSHQLQCLLSKWPRYGRISRTI